MTQPLPEVPEVPAVPAQELEVLAAAARGETARQTYRRLHVSPRSLFRLRESAVKRLGAQRFVHAVALAVAAGLITVEPAAGGEGDG